MFISTLLMSIVLSGAELAPAMVIRTASGADRVTPLNQLREVTFPRGMLCVKEVAGGDFTVTDSEFVSIKFRSTDGESAIGEITADTSAAEAFYDLSGRYAGSSASGLSAGVYIVVKPGQKPVKTVIR